MGGAAGSAGDASEGKGPQRRPQSRLGRRLEGVCRSGWGRLLSVTNAIEAGTWRQGQWLGIGRASWRGGGYLPPLPMHPSGSAPGRRAGPGPYTPPPLVACFPLRSRPPQRSYCSPAVGRPLVAVRCNPAAFGDPPPKAPLATAPTAVHDGRWGRRTGAHTTDGPSPPAVTDHRPCGTRSTAPHKGRRGAAPDSPQHDKGPEIPLPPAPWVWLPVE